MLSCYHHDLKYDCDLSAGFKTWYSYLGSVPFHAFGMMSVSTAITTYLPLLDTLWKHN